jgi:hypothetical protein
MAYVLGALLFARNASRELLTRLLDALGVRGPAAGAAPD